MKIPKELTREHVLRAIEDLDQLLVPGITLTEVFKNVFRHRDEKSALVTVAHMQQGRALVRAITLDHSETLQITFAACRRFH